MNTFTKTLAAAAFAGFSAFALPASADYLRNAPDFYPREMGAPVTQSNSQWRAPTSPARQNRGDDIRGRYNGASQSIYGNGYSFN